MRKAIAVIGEGITEKYYIDSLQGLSPFRILPQELGKKASNIIELKSSIDKAIEEGFDEVFCLIDMDGKRQGKSKSDYYNIKNKYHDKIHGNKKKGIQCKVIFIETERCTELWFLYHFTKSAITREFFSYKEIEKELQKYRPSYQKNEKYFKSTGGLHYEFTKKREPLGSVKKAVENANNSMISKKREDRNHTYSEIHLLIKKLKIPLE